MAATRTNPLIWLMVTEIPKGNQRVRICRVCNSLQNSPSPNSKTAGSANQPSCPCCRMPQVPIKISNERKMNRMHRDTM